MNACQQELSEPVTDYESTQTTHARELSIAISKARIIPGSPGKVTFAVENRCDWDFEVVSSAFEIKCTKIGARHALPKAGWGYAVTDAVRPATLLPARSELWTTFEADTRTTFRGAVPSTAPSSFEPQYYFSGHLLYRRFRGELLETSVYRRLAYPELECCIIEPNDAGLNKGRARRLCLSLIYPVRLDSPTHYVPLQRRAKKDEAPTDDRPGLR